MRHLSFLEIKALIVFCTLTLSISITNARDYSSWMAELPDDAYVAALSIPGTHDSATGHGFTGGIAFQSSAQTQDMTVGDQMKIGVRAFDFRPASKNAGSIINKNYRLRCYHGIAEINYWFDDAIKEICTYLDNHPSEFFIIHLYKAKDDKDTNDLYNALVNDEAVAPHIASFRPDLKVKDMRGKILFLKRWEVDWSSDKIAYLWDWSETEWKTGEYYIKNMYEDQKCRIVMQDKANTDGGNKINLFKELFAFSSSYTPAHEKDMVWIMNFASSYNGTTSSRTSYCENASKVLPAIIDLLEKAAGPTGIVFMDWVGDYTHLNKYDTRGETAVHVIADNNFRYLPSLCNPVVAAPKFGKENLDAVNMPHQGMFRGNTEWIDLNSDGYLDLAVKGRDVNDGWWPKYMGMYNNGSSFESAHYLPRIGGNEYDDNRSRIIIPIDYNADGHMDMIYGCSAGSLLLHNDGEGNFSEPLNDNGECKFTLYGQDINLDKESDGTIERRGVSGLMLTADFDLDGYPDILTYHVGENGTDGTPFMYRNESGAFGCAFFGKNCGIPALKNGTMAVGDFDCDGAPDVLISGVNESGVRQVSICLNRGFSDYFNFEVFTPAEVQPYATDLGIVNFVDVNNDGRLDLYISGRLRDTDNRMAYAANIFINKGDGSFFKPYAATVPVCHSGMDWCDLDGDGYVDIVYGGSANIFNGIDGDKNGQYQWEYTGVIMNQGDGSFYGVNPGFESLRGGVSVRAVDLNMDGTAAVAMMGYGSDCFSVYRSESPARGGHRLLSAELDAEIFDNGDGTTTLSWTCVGDGLRYNYVVEMKDGHIFSAVPVDVETGNLRVANVDAATTGNSVTLRVDAAGIKRYGVQAISQGKTGGPLQMMSVNDNHETTEIGRLEAEESPVEYYNLQGQRVAHPSGGIFIELRGRKAVKRHIP